jgi:transcription elongation GreA/GreB family factor
MNITKKELIQSFITYLQDELESLTAAAKATYEAATHEESKPENQYDTRALEASYLAGAQAERVAEIREVLRLFQTLEFKPNTERVLATALVDVNIDDKKSTLLIMPKGGGITLRLPDRMVQIVTPHSLLGEAILGSRVGDEVEYEVADNVHVCEILAVQ